MSDVDIVWRAGWQQGADLIFQLVEETLMIERSQREQTFQQTEHLTTPCIVIFFACIVPLLA